VLGSGAAGCGTGAGCTDAEAGCADAIVSAERGSAIETAECDRRDGLHDVLDLRRCQPFV
jgi:hypothetical protein